MPRRKSKTWLGGVIATAAMLAVAFFLSRGRHERQLSSAASVMDGTNRVLSIGQTTAAKVEPDTRENVALPLPTASVAEKTFANWSSYHSAQGRFSVYLPDRREGKQHVRSETLGIDGQGVQAQFVQLPNTSDPIESWPAIGEVWLRAIWVDNSERASLSPATLVPAGATSSTVAVGHLPGTEFVFKKGNETQKARLFVTDDRTIILTASFVGRESGDEGGLPFGEQVDRFLDSLRLTPEPVDKVPASFEGETVRSW